MVVIILDFETSGLNPYQDDIIEIGAKVMGTDNYYTTLVKPRSDKLINAKITEITGITNRLLRKEGKKWLEAYKDFYNWLMEQFKDGEENMIVSHNGETFDFLFFRKMLMCLQGENEDISKIKEYNIIYIDTLLLSRRLLSNRSYYTQRSLCNTFNIIEENPIIRLLLSGKKYKNNDVVKEEKFKAIIILIKKERRDAKLTKKPFLYPLYVK